MKKTLVRISMTLVFLFLVGWFINALATQPWTPTLIVLILTLFILGLIAVVGTFSLEDKPAFHCKTPALLVDPRLVDPPYFTSKADACRAYQAKTAQD